MPCYRIRYLLCYLANAKKSDYYCPTRGRRKNFVLVGYMATKKIILLLFPPIKPLYSIKACLFSGHRSKGDSDILLVVRLKWG